MRLVVIGSDAGISAALRARELTGDVEATVLVADEHPNFSIGGLPCFVSGATPDWHQLAHRTLDELEQTGMRLLLSHTATSIDPSRHAVCVEGRDGQTSALGYVQLVATGAGPIRPALPVDAINELDLSYTPPRGSPWDAVQLDAAQAWTTSGKGGLS